MFRQLSILEVRAGDERIHTYSCPPNSPLGEVHDSLCAMKAHVLDQMQEEAKKDKKVEQIKIPEGEVEPDINKTYKFGSKESRCEV